MEVVTWQPAMTAGVVGAVVSPDGDVGALLPHAAMDTLTLNRTAARGLVTYDWTTHPTVALHQKVMSAIWRM